MATRWYLSADMSLKVPATIGTWDNNPPGSPTTFEARTGAQYPANWAGTWSNATEFSGSAVRYCITNTTCYQYITQSLAAQTINSGATFRLQTICWETAAAANAYIHLKVRRFNSSGVQQGSDYDADGVTELPGTLETDAVNRYAQITLGANITVNSGDYLVFELGFYFNNTMTATYDGYLHLSYNPGSSDLGANETDTDTNLNPWIECSQTINFSSGAGVLATDLIDGSASAGGTLTGKGALASSGLISGIATLTAPNTCKATTSATINSTSTVSPSLGTKVAAATNLINGTSSCGGTLSGKIALSSNLVNGAATCIGPLLGKGALATNLVNCVSTFVGGLYGIGYLATQEGIGLPTIGGSSSLSGVLTGSSFLNLSANISSVLPFSNVLDNFDRPNEGPPVTGWTQLPWYGGNSNLTINNNAIKPVVINDTFAYFNNRTFGPNCAAYATIGNNSPADITEASVLLRLDPAANKALAVVYASNGYGGNNANETVGFIWICHASNLSLTLQTASGEIPPLVVGDQLGGKVVGNTIVGSIKRGANDWQDIISYESNYCNNAGYLGIQLYGVPLRTFLDFGGGNTWGVEAKLNAGLALSTNLIAGSSTCAGNLTGIQAGAVVLSASDYINAGGTTATTFQLTAPAGKSSSNFLAGKISDDTNPLSNIDLESGQFTEIEFCIKLTDAASIDDIYQFRITANGTPLSSYLQTFQITVVEEGAGVELATNLINSISSVSGELLGKQSLSSNLINGTASFSSTLLGRLGLASNLINGVGTFNAAATLSVASNLVNGVASCSGGLLGKQSLASNLINCVSTLNVAATLKIASNLISGTATCVGDLLGKQSLASNLIGGISTVGGTLQALTSGALSTNLINGTASFAGELLGKGALASNLINGAGNVSGTLLGKLALSSNLINGTSNVSGIFIPYVFLSTNLINGVGSCSSTLTGKLALSSNLINSTSTSVGNLLGKQNLSTNLINSVSTLIGDLQAFSSGALASNLINGISTVGGTLLASATLSSNLINGTSTTSLPLYGKLALSTNLIGGICTTSGVLAGQLSLATNLINSTSTMSAAGLLGTLALSTGLINCVSTLSSTLSGNLALSTNLINGTSTTLGTLSSLAISIEQFSFRFRQDNGNEANATWIDAINANISIQAEVNTRLRFLINATQNPDPSIFKLEYKKSTDTEWTAVA